MLVKKQHTGNEVAIVTAGCFCTAYKIVTACEVAGYMVGGFCGKKG